MLVGDNEQELFLGRELQQRHAVSEKTAQLVDAEVSRIIKEAYARATAVLSENLDLLHRVAEALLERETLSGSEVRLLSDGGSLPPHEPDISRRPPAVKAPAKGAKAAAPPLLGGPEVAPA
jgi:cell division protease FtsH